MVRNENDNGIFKGEDALFVGLISLNREIDPPRLKNKVESEFLS